MKKIVLTFGCCLHGMFDEILLFCTLFMAFMTTKSLKLVKGMDHPGIFSLTVCKKIKNQNQKLIFTDSQPWCLFFFLTQTKPNATLKCRITQPRFQRAWIWEHASLTAGNALERVQRVHEPADLWDITFWTRWFWGL